MNLKELDILANSKIAIEKTMPIAEYGYCLKMRELYADYKNGLISLESCKNRKKEIIEEYNQISSCVDTYKKYQEAILKAKNLRAEINKSSNPDDMLTKALKCISLMTNDETFYNMNMKKIERSN